MITATLPGIVERFRIDSAAISVAPYGNGHINDTFLVVCESGTRYILQRINRTVFPDPAALMENITLVTAYLRDRIVENGGDPLRETLNVIPTKEGKAFVEDEEQNAFRCYLFVENTVCLERAETAAEFYESGRAFGRFQQMLDGFPADRLHETLPAFHDTGKRFEALKAAAEADVMGRAASVCRELEFAFARAEDMTQLTERQQNGTIPLRVTHNDTKLNNILMDAKNLTGLCIIDLDTVMPGLAATDYGDSIRFGANTATEDERDLSKVSLDVTLFEAYTKGFLEGCDNRLTPAEVETLPWGAKLMTLECGMRFLTDYLQGDTYFKIHREGHNLDRCRTQFRLVADMETKWDTMQKIVSRYAVKE